MHAGMTFTHFTFTISGIKAVVILNIILIKSPDDTVYTHPRHRKHGVCIVKVNLVEKMHFKRFNA